MRTLVVLIVALTAGCLDSAPETGEASQDLVYYTPRAAIVARIAGARKAADDLRALAARTTMPVYPTWAVLNEYRSLVQVDHDSADQCDTFADALEAKLALTSDMDALSTTSELDMLKMQQLMERNAQAVTVISNALKAMHETTESIIGNLK